MFNDLVDAHHLTQLYCVVEYSCTYSNSEWYNLPRIGVAGFPFSSISLGVVTCA